MRSDLRSPILLRPIHRSLHDRAFLEIATAKIAHLGMRAGVGLGGLQGGLTGWGVPRRQIPRYGGTLRDSKYLLAVDGSGDEQSREQGVEKTDLQHRGWAPVT
jgi:hypothetical protein